MEIEELKKMIIDSLCEEYSLEDATQQVNESEIIVNDKNVKIIYSNGKSNNYELIVVQKLKLVS